MNNDNIFLKTFTCDRGYDDVVIMQFTYYNNNISKLSYNMSFANDISKMLLSISCVLKTHQ